MEGLNEALVDV